MMQINDIGPGHTFAFVANAFDFVAFVVDKQKASLSYRITGVAQTKETSV